MEHKAGTKLKNTFFVLADTKIQNNIEYFKYNGILMLKTFSFEKFLEALKLGILKIDFDARNGYKRSGHNHGTKFRIATNLLPTLYEEVTIIFDEPLHSKERIKTIDISTTQSIKSYRAARDIEKAAGEGPTIVQMPLSTDERPKTI